MQRNLESLYILCTRRTFNSNNLVKFHLPRNKKIKKSFLRIPFVYVEVLNCVHFPLN